MLFVVVLLVFAGGGGFVVCFVVAPAAVVVGGSGVLMSFWLNVAAASTFGGRARGRRTIPKNPKHFF